MRVAAVIGSPVHHSLSPAIHNAAFVAAGLDWVYVAFEVAPGAAGGALDAMRTLDLGGLSVTTPHKEDVARGVDELDPAAAALRSVNTVVWDADGRLVGHSTDGAGFVASLAASGVDVGGATVAVVGAGAAARSVVDALGRAGAADVAVVNRTRDPRRRGRRRLDRRPGSARSTTWPPADIVVNATSIGMGTDDVPFDVGAAPPGPGRGRPRVPPAGDGPPAGRCGRRVHDRRRSRDVGPPGRAPAGAVDRSPSGSGADAIGGPGRAGPPNHPLTEPPLGG